MGFFERNVQLLPPRKISPWRKIALGTWSRPTDATVYGTMELNAEAGLKWIQELNEKTGVRVTLTHLLTSTFAKILERHPEVNTVLRWGRFYPRENIDIFIQVATDQAGTDLSGVLIRNANEKDVVALARETEEKIDRVRNQGDPSFRKAKEIYRWVPGFLSRFLLELSGWIMYGWNLWSPFLGAKKDPMGSIMISNIGALGLDNGVAPLVPYCRVPFIVAMGRVKDAPVCDGDTVRVGKTITVWGTFDHRVVDGIHISRISKDLRRIFENPREELGASF